MMSIQNVTTEEPPVVSCRVPHKGTLSDFIKWPNEADGRSKQ